MQLLLRILAAAGLLALVLRSGRVLLRLLLGAAETVATREAVNVQARRGDLTGREDALAAYDGARRRRRASLLRLLLCVGLLLLPPLTPWPALIAASYNVLWFLPQRSLRRS